MADWSTARKSIENSIRSGLQRLLRAALFVLFALWLLIPRLLGLRRRRKSWNLLRAGAAVAGFALLAGTLLGLSRMTIVLAIALVLFAVLARPAGRERSVDEQAREVGALVVINGGRLRLSPNRGAAARLFVGPERVGVFDLQHHPLLEIPLADISAVRTEAVPDGWQVRVEWKDSAAEFFYDGFFAEHLARVAEDTLRGLLRRELPILR